MKKFIQIVREILSIEELRKKLLLTLGLIIVYRLMAQVVLPGIDAQQLSLLESRTSEGILGLLSAFTGGAFSRVSIMALGIMPYISASIVIQLMGMAVPYLQKLQRDGESGRNKINQITRWLTIGITLVQGSVYITSLPSLGIPETAYLLGNGGMFWFSSMILLTTGTVFAMWLGERITERGIGNGISLLIMIGIVARFPIAFVQELGSKYSVGSGGFMMILFEMVLWFLIIMATVLLITTVRKVFVQYAGRNPRSIDIQKTRQYIPLKLNSAGVMPIIFSQAIMFIPSVIARNTEGMVQTVFNSLSDFKGWGYNILFALLIIVFSYFYTAITIPTNRIAEDLKRSGGFIPGVRPGIETADRLDEILSRLTLSGSIFLALLAIFPAIVIHLGVQQEWAVFYGGTSLVIMVGVVMDTIHQINSYLLSKHYGGLMNMRTKKRKVIQ